MKSLIFHIINLNSNLTKTLILWNTATEIILYKIISSFANFLISQFHSTDDTAQPYFHMQQQKLKQWNNVNAENAMMP